MLIRDPENDGVDPGIIAAGALASGALAGVVGGVLMLALLMTAGGLADAATAKEGVESSIVSVPNAVTAFTFQAGLDAFQAGFAWETYPGVVVHLLVATLLGMGGVGLIAILFGRRPRLPAALLCGALYGIVLEIVILNGFVNGVQDVDFVYTAAPEWSWWAAHALYGATVGLVGGALLRRAPASAEDAL